MRIPLEIFSWSSRNLPFLYLPILFLLFWIESASGFGSMGPISAAFGDDGFFCAIDASGKQEVICWGKGSNLSSSSPSVHSAEIPPLAALSGGDGFICGILANTSLAYCWDSAGSSSELVPPIFRTTAYSHVAAGQNHVCAIRGSYFSDTDSGTVDCWDIVRTSNNSLSSKQSTLFYNQIINTRVFKRIVSGEGFTCGVIREGDLVCWGPNSVNLGISSLSENFITLASGIDSLCGVSELSGEIKCWGNNDSFSTPPIGTRFVSLTAGARHFCGIREDNHGIECWGSFNSSSVPKNSGFSAIASSDYFTCGIREDDLVLDCWFANVTSLPDFDPPLELCNPGLCTSDPCGEGKFSFNASLLNEPDLTSLCVRKDLRICLPCGLNCSIGFFPSSSCTENADRVCTPCSLCQNSSCWDICRLQSSPEIDRSHRHRHFLRLLIIVSAASGSLLIFIGVCLLFCSFKPGKGNKKKQFGSCIGKKEVETNENLDTNHAPAIVPPLPGMAQVFRLSELKDATNGFKEFNELGRGSYGFVYKALLPDGRQVAVKRANAATIIQTNSRNFETELEILCNLRHGNIVNLLGYCAEMGERLLVYEFMPHGTLHDHLHGGLSPLNWSLRLKLAAQASKGLEYLHTQVSLPIVHRDVKSSNILLDSDWVARIADFGLVILNGRDLNSDMKTDVYDFGVVLLEILSGRKGYDRDCVTPNIVEWAVPLIREGKAAAIIDRYVALPRNVDPLLKLADVAELAVRENPVERPTVSELVVSLELILKDGLIL